MEPKDAVATINELAHGSQPFVVNTEALPSLPLHTVVRRNRPGSKAGDWCKWPVLSFDEMRSPLAVQQLVQEVVRAKSDDPDALLNAPEESGIEEQVWKYECLRQFCLELNLLAAKLQTECSPQSCPQMSATEQWQFLCASHKQPKECSAIDYIRHTLDGAAAIMNSSKYFPSRVTVKEASVSKLGSICRRVYRIFSHAFFNHRTLFDEFENETSLCRRFTRFVLHHQLVTPDSIIVPIE